MVNQHTVRNLRRIVALAIAIGLAFAGFSSPAHGQATGSVELVAQSSWVDDGGIFDIQVRIAGADPESSVVVRVLPAWLERDDFLRTDIPEDTQALLELEPVVLGDVQNTSNEVLGFQILVAGPDSPIEQAEGTPIPVLQSNGGSNVYPLEVSLLRPDGTVGDQFITSLIELPRGQRNAPLQTAIILEAHMQPTMLPSGQTQLDPEELDSVEVLVSAMAQHPAAEVALSISPEVLVGLSTSQNERSLFIIDELRSVKNPRQFLINPFTEVEEQAWVDVGLTAELRELYELGSGLTNTILGVQPNPSVMLLDRTIDDEGLEALTTPSDDPTTFGVEGVIVRPAQITPLSSDLFPQALTTQFVIPTSEGRTVPALVADGGLANHFTNPGGAVFNANRILADLTLLSLQNSEVRQAVVLNPPADWEPDATLLNVMLTGIERIPAIQGASPANALADTAFTPARGIGTLSSPLQRELNPRRQPADLRSFRTEFSQARTAIDSWSEVIAGDQASTDRLESLLLVSTDYRLTDTQRSDYIESIYGFIDQQKENAITTPDSDTITLTGRRSDIPITVNNDLGVDANVLIVLDSEKLSFPDGRTIEATLRPGQNRLEIPIEARASGDSPIRVQIFTPDRSVLLGSSQVLIRIFAFSGVGIIIGAVSLVVLLLWWLRHSRSRRSSIRDHPSASAPESTDTDAPATSEHIGV